jgi:cell division septum initiation protein DivIVA
MESPPEETPDWAEALIEEVTDLRQEVKRLRANIRRSGVSPIPEEHKYSLTKQTVEHDDEEQHYCPVGVRLVSGRRPADLSTERLYREAGRAPSRRTIERLAADEEGVLDTVKMGGSTYVTERSIQHYEQGMEEGWVKGYNVIDAMK